MKGNPINSEQPMEDDISTNHTTEHYCYVYNDLMALMNTTNSLSEVQFVNYICMHLSRLDKGVVYITSGYKEKAAKEIGCHDKSIERARKSLIKKRVLISMPDSSRSKMFYVNPLFIWKGDINTRVATIELLGLNSKAKSFTHLTKGPKAKVKRLMVKRDEIDFTVSIKERKRPVRAVLKELQEKLNYTESLCKKFYEYYTRITGKRRTDIRSWSLKGWH